MADREAIEAEIRERFEEPWAVVFTDLVGFSKRTERFGIIHFLGLIHAMGRLLRPPIVDAGGRVLKEEADSWLILFPTARTAIETMETCRRRCDEYSRGRPDEERLELCVGIGYGPILRVGWEDAWGQQVNIASRLGEDLAKAGEILLSDGARTQAEREGVELEVVPYPAPRMASPCWRLVRRDV